MSGFFDVASVHEQPAMPAVELPILRAAARQWAGQWAAVAADRAARGADPELSAAG